MHFITQLHLFLELALLIYSQKDLIFLVLIILTLSLSAHGFSGSPRPGFLSTHLPPEVVGVLLEPTLS